MSLLKKKSTFALSKSAVIAQSVERQLPKLKVAGSNPVYRSFLYKERRREKVYSLRRFFLSVGIKKPRRDCEA